MTFMSQPLIKTVSKDFTMLILKLADHNNYNIINVTQETQTHLHKTLDRITPLKRHWVCFYSSLNNKHLVMIQKLLTCNMRARFGKHARELK